MDLCRQSHGEAASWILPALQKVGGFDEEGVVWRLELRGCACEHGEVADASDRVQVEEALAAEGRLAALLHDGGHGDNARAAAPALHGACGQSLEWASVIWHHQRARKHTCSMLEATGITCSGTLPGT